MLKRLALILACAIPLAAASAAAQEQPVVYSQTIIAIVPGNTVPKAITEAPEVQATPQDATGDATTSITEQMLAEAKQAATEKIRLRVQVRPDQISPSHGIITQYRLDAANGVLTYYSHAAPRQLEAENIPNPVDVLFIRDDGIVAQIVPEIVLAYLPESIDVTFPVRALLFMEAGLSTKWGIQPGYRVEHGMFKPKPLIYKVDE